MRFCIFWNEFMNSLIFFLQTGMRMCPGLTFLILRTHIFVMIRTWLIAFWNSAICIHMCSHGLCLNIESIRQRTFLIAKSMPLVKCLMGICAQRALLAWNWRASRAAGSRWCIKQNKKWISSYSHCHILKVDLPVTQLCVPPLQYHCGM